MSGCIDEEAKLKKLDKDETATIKVMSDREVSYFYRQYGSLFLAKYPNIDLQVASTQGAIKSTPGMNIMDINKEYKKFIDEQRPDVLLLRLDQYEDYAAEGRLYELDAVIKQDKFDLTGIEPAIIDTIKSRSGGKLYGMTPGFTGRALYYNKSLFAKYGVPLPKDRMTWEELLAIARRFPTTGEESDRIYGFAFSTDTDDAMQYVRMIGDSKGLSYIDADSGTVTIHTETWKQAAQLVFEAIKSGAIYVPSPNKPILNGVTTEERYKSDPFTSGKVAMTIKGNYFLNELKSATPHLKDQMPDWDLVTLPIDPQNPDGAGSMALTIFAINAQSPNLRAAWEFVKYVDDDEYARVISRSQMDLSSLPTRTKYLKEANNRNLAAFAMLSGNPNKAMTTVPIQFTNIFLKLANTEFRSVLEEKKTVDEALQTIQDKGQQELLRAKKTELIK